MELFGAGDTIMAERWFLLVFSTIFIIFPLTLLSRINSLRYAHYSRSIQFLSSVFFYFLFFVLFLYMCRHTSLLGFAATAYLLVAVIADTSRRIADDGTHRSTHYIDVPVHSFVQPHEWTRFSGLDSDRVSAANFSSRIFVGLPIIFYGFSSHVNIFSIYRYATRNARFGGSASSAAAHLSPDLCFVIYSAS
jgi:amino acid permease